jgi:hypothetical protein
MGSLRRTSNTDRYVTNYVFCGLASPPQPKWVKHDGAVRYPIPQVYLHCSTVAEFKTRLSYRNPGICLPGAVLDGGGSSISRFILNRGSTGLFVAGPL